MTGTFQRELPIERVRVTIRQPLMKVSAFGGAFTPGGLTPDEVIVRIEDGTHDEHVPWAFNISATQGPPRREVRVLAALALPAPREALRRADLADVLGIIFPAHKHTGLHPALRESERFITGTEFQWAVDCSDSGHVTNLIESSALRVLTGTSWQRGPNGSPAISFASITEFFGQRKI